MARPIIEPENQSTIVVVTFILSLLALTFTFYTFNRLNEAATVLAGIDVGLYQRNTKALDEAKARIDALEKEVADLKAAKAAAPAE